MGSISLEHAIDNAIRLYQSAKLNEAATLCNQILAIDPNQIEALNLSGLLAIARDDFLTAEKHLRKALAIDPASIYTINNLGITLYQLDQFAESAFHFQQVVERDPSNPMALNNLGESLNHLGRHEEALACCQKAVALSPECASFYQTLGVSSIFLGRYTEALQYYDKALELAPADRANHIYRATTLLSLGRLSEGWQEYEHRRYDQHSAVAAATQASPQWDGGTIEGKTILVHAEQGIGDNIQFFRYLHMLLRRSAQVIYQCRPDMRGLFSQAGGITVISREDPIPQVDVQCRIMSLPCLFRTTLENIPGEVPYLRADEAKSVAWRQRMKDIPGKHVGLVWAGNPKHSNDARRSMMLKNLFPLLETPGITFFSLQLGPAATQTSALPASVRWVDWTNGLTDLTETAALINNLDLVISVDTAMAHLAGALGRPVWTMLQFAAEFRWMLDRSDTPWYPTMRLFRQTAPNQWDNVIREVIVCAKMF